MPTDRILQEIEAGLDGDKAIDDIIAEIEQIRKDDEQAINDKILAIKETAAPFIVRPRTLSDALRVGAIDVTSPSDIEDEDDDISRAIRIFGAGLAFNNESVTQALGAPEPEGATEIGLDIAGNVVGGVATAVGAGRAVKAAGTALKLGGAAQFIGRVGIEAGAVAALTPEDDLAFQAGIVGAADLGVNVLRIPQRAAARLFNLSKSKDAGLEQLALPNPNKPSDISKELNKLFKAVDNIDEVPVDNIKPITFLNKIKKFNETATELDNLRKAKQVEFDNSINVPQVGDIEFTSFIKQGQDLVDEQLTKVADLIKDPKTFIQANAVDGREAFARLSQQLNSVTTSVFTKGDVSDLLKVRVGSLADDVVEGTVGITNREIPPSLQGEIDELFDIIESVDDRIALGLKPDEPIEGIIKRSEEIQKKVTNFEDAFLNDDKYLKIKSDLNKQLKEFVDDPDSLLSEDFQNTSDYIKFLDNIKKHSTEEVGVDKFLKAEASISDINNLKNPLPESIRKSIEQTVSNLDQGTTNSLKAVTNFIESGRPLDAISEDANVARVGLTRFLTSFLNKQGDDIIIDLPGIRGFKTELLGAPPELQAKIKQDFINEVLINPQLGNEVLGRSKDTRKIYQLFQAIHGNQEARVRLNFESKLADVVEDGNLATSELMDAFVPGGEQAYADYLGDVTDLNPFQRQAFETDRVVRRFIDTPFGAPLGRGVEELNLAKNQFLTFAREEIDQKVIKTLRDAFKGAPDVVSEGAASLLRQVDDLADVGRVAGKGDDVIQGEIDTILAKQTPEVKALYNQYRKAADDGLEFVNSKIEEYNKAVADGLIKGEELSLISRKPGFLPHVWEGSYRVKYIDNVDGKDVVRILNNGVDTNADALKAIEDFLDLNPEFNNKIIVEPKILATLDDEFDTIGVLGQQVDNLYGRDASDLRKLRSSGGLKKEELQNLFFGNRLRRSANLEGFIDDPLKALHLYLYSGSKFAHFLKPIRTLENIAQQATETVGGDGQQFKQLGQWIRTLTNDTIGRPRKSAQYIDNFITGTLAKVFGDSPVLKKMGFAPGSSVTKGVSSGLLSFGRAATIGFNPSTALINYGLLFTNVSSTLGGGVTGKTFLRSLSRQWWKSTKYQPLLDRAGLKVIEGGATLRTGLEDSPLDGITTRGRHFFDNLSLTFFNGTERHARAVTIVAARDSADDIAKKLAGKIAGGKKLTFLEDVYKQTADRLELPVDSNAVKDQFAIDFMRRTNFDFDVVGLPEIFRNPVAKPALQFKTFMLRQMEFMFGLRGFELFKAVGMTSLLGGVFAIPGLNALDLISRSVWGVSPKLWAQQTFGDEISNGAPRLAGFDISQRLTIDDYNFVSETNAFGISGGKFTEFIKAAWGGDMNRAQQIATPIAIRNVLNAKELIETGEVRSDFSGNLVLSDKDINNPFLAAIPVALGFETNALRDGRSVSDLLRKRTKNINKRKQVAKKKAVKALRRGDMKAVSKIAKRHGFSLKEIRQSMNRQDLTQKDALKKTLSKDQRGTPELDLLN